MDTTEFKYEKDGKLKLKKRLCDSTYSREKRKNH